MFWKYNDVHCIHTKNGLQVLEWVKRWVQSCEVLGKSSKIKGFKDYTRKLVI